jgi:hypothetical protein
LEDFSELVAGDTSCHRNVGISKENGMRLASPRRSTRLVVVLALALLAAVAVYGVAASNTVPNGQVGSGAGTISGYAVSDVTYTLNASTPSALDGVHLTLDDAASTVKVKLVSAGSTWYTCALDTSTTGEPNDWECDTTGATVASADELTVVAAS